jgi:hypothetical protein
LQETHWQLAGKALAACRKRTGDLQESNHCRLLAADVSLGLSRTYFCTLSNITVDTNYNRGVESGHHGIDVGRGRDNLITDCVFLRHLRYSSAANSS